MHKTTMFNIQPCVVVKLFSLEDAWGFIAESASFYATVESGGGMHMVNHFKYLQGNMYVK